MEGGTLGGGELVSLSELLQHAEWLREGIARYRTTQSYAVQPTDDLELYPTYMLHVPVGALHTIEDRGWAAQLLEAVSS